MSIQFRRLRDGGTGEVGVNDSVYVELYHVYEDTASVLRYDVALAYMQGQFPIFNPGPNDTRIDKVKHRLTLNKREHYFTVRYRKNFQFGGSQQFESAQVTVQNTEVRLTPMRRIQDAGGPTIVDAWRRTPEDEGVPYYRATTIRRVRKLIPGTTITAVEDAIADNIGAMYEIPSNSGRLYVFQGGTAVEVDATSVQVVYQFFSKAVVPEIDTLAGEALDVPFPRLAALEEYGYPGDFTEDPTIGVIAADELYRTDGNALP